MLNKKILLTSLIILTTGVSYAYTPFTLNDLTRPKEAAYRVGISDVPENQYIEAQIQKPDEIIQNIVKITDKDSDNINTNYAELSIKNLSREVSQDLMFEEQDMVADLSLLWQGAAMQSDTINFALYKLANPDADKPNKSTIKNMLKTIASMSTLVGSAVANPLLAGTSFITGDVLGIMGQDTKALNYKYTKVTDADMIILIRKVEDLQQTAVNLYYDYMTSKKQLEMASNLVLERQKRFQLAQKNNVSKEMLVVTDAYYRTALDKQRAARAEFLSKRATLEQFVGNETFTQFEEELAQRENNEKSASTMNKSEQDEAYNQTIKNVEEYKNSLENSAITKNNSEETDEELLAAKSDKYSTKGLIFVHDNDRYRKEPWELSAEEQAAAAAQTTEQQPVDKKTKKKTKHNKEEIEGTSAQTNTETQFIPTLPAATQNQATKTKTFNGVELLPLDDIKVPERQFRKSGYSIFAE